MKEVLQTIKNVLSPEGFSKKKNSFFKIDRGFYLLIDIQSSAHRGNYFFVNICVHPVGLPLLQMNVLEIPKNPHEYECILRQRIEQIIPKGKFTGEKIGFFGFDDKDAILELTKVLKEDVLLWFETWTNWRTIISADESDILSMLTVVPKIKQKAYHMLTTFGFKQVGKNSEALNALKNFLEADSGGYNFSLVDRYIESVVRDGTRAKLLE